jgi:tetratricopeptide (TPR) repeat protein
MSRSPLVRHILCAAVVALAHYHGFAEDTLPIPSLPPLKNDLMQELSEESKAALLRKIAALENAEQAAPSDPAIRSQLGAAYFQLGAGYFKTGKPKESTDAFRKAVGFEPAKAEAWEGLGIGLNALDKIDDALEAFQRAAEADPKSFDIWIARGAALLRARRGSEAVAAFAKATELDPESKEAHAILAFALLQVGKPKDALEAFDRALKISPHDSETLANRALALLGTNDLPGAIAATQSALTANPDNLTARRNLASFLETSHRYEEAALAAQAVIAREPSDKQAWVILGEADIKRERYKEGVEEMEKALVLGFDSPEASLELATGLVGVARFDDAEKTLAGLVSKNSHDANALAALGNLRLKQKRLEESNRYCEQALAIDPKNVVALLSLANNCVTANQPDKAIRHAQEALAVEPDSWRAWGVIGMAEEQRNNPAAALAAYRRIAQMVPQQFVGWQGVAQLSSDYAEACSAAARALQSSPDDLAEQVLLPYTQARLGNYSDALATYEAALKKYPRNTMLAEEFSKLLSSQRSPEQALQKFQGLVEQRPDWPLGWRMVGYNFVMLHRYSEAEEAMQKAIHLDETEPIFWRDLGVIYLVLFSTENAIRFAVKSESALRKALELDPNVASASLQLSMALLAQHRAIEAEDFCLRAIQRDANSIYAWQTLGRIRAERGHFPEAVQAVETAIKFSPKDASSWQVLQELFARHNDRTGQMKELRNLAAAGAESDNMELVRQACDKVAESDAPLAAELRRQYLK